MDKIMKLAKIGYKSRNATDRKEILKLQKEANKVWNELNK